MPRQKVAVLTGGAGFLGSHLCDKLIEQRGYKVICVDNLKTGNLRNIQHLRKDKNFVFLKHDVSKPFRVPGKVDYVLHFASPASPVDYLMYPIPTLKVGSLGAYNTLGLAKLKKARYLIASTSEVYGDPLVHPQKESYWGHVNTIGPRGCYDEAKRFQEAITMAYHRYHKVNTGMVRIFNTYGPRMRINDGRVVPNFIHQALHNKSITIFGDGKQTRSFCYYSDLIEGITRLIHTDYHLPVNIGNPGEYTMLQLAKLITTLANTKSKIVYRPLPTDDPKQRKPDITLAKKLLKWEPQVHVKDGLAKTIDWFENNPS